MKNSQIRSSADSMLAKTAIATGLLAALSGPVLANERENGSNELLASE